MVTIILHYPHCGSQARVTPRAFPQWQTEGSLSCLQPPQPRESDSHCLSRSAPRGDRACLPRTRASCAASPVRSGSLGPPEPGGSKKRSATSSLTDNTAGSGSPRVHFHGAGTGCRHGTEGRCQQACARGVCSPFEGKQAVRLTLLPLLQAELGRPSKGPVAPPP